MLYKFISDSEMTLDYLESGSSEEATSDIDNPHTEERTVDNELSEENNTDAVLNVF